MIRLADIRVKADAFLLQIDELAVRPGEYVVIVGPTGSGKTVLLETIAGLRRPSQGCIWFGDRNVTHVPPERRGAGFVYQDYALFPHLSVAENIAFGIASRRRAHRKGDCSTEVERLAALLGIRDLLERYPESLSGGERQRVALARALAIEPQILLLDEPLSALDRSSRRVLRQELKHLHAALRTTVLHVTHDLDEALVLGDQLAVLVGGQMRQMGPPSEVVRRPADDEVARLLGMTNVFPVKAMTFCEGYVELLLQGSDREGAASLFRLAAPSPAAGYPNEPLVAVLPSEEIILSTGNSEEAAWESVESGKACAEFLSRPRNLLKGVIKDIQMHDAYIALQVQVPSLLTVHVSWREAVRAGLSVGSWATVQIPPEVVHVCPARSSRDNQGPE